MKKELNMQVKKTVCRGRRGWELDNGTLKLVMLEGGGHLASLMHRERPNVNPFWVPIWKTIEPWTYRPGDAARYEARLLASLCGHNLCLGWFGQPSDAEKRAGMGGHGEAPVARWRLVKKSAGPREVVLVCRCDLPVAAMRFTRTVRMCKGSSSVQIREEIDNLTRRDQPFTMCEHVTFGPPFLKKGVTLFDMPATEAHTFPDAFSTLQRLKADAAFRWPKAPRAKGGKVDLRTIGSETRKSSDFSTQLIDPRRDDAWFSAVNPEQGVMMAYVWKRSDFPWVGNWEENYERAIKPWSNRSLTRGMEFANTPFPQGLRRAVDRGTFQGQPTFQWLPAREKVTMDYEILSGPVARDCKGVRDIRRSDGGWDVLFR
jgi:hypothetical protein